MAGGACAGQETGGEGPAVEGSKEVAVRDVGSGGATRPFRASDVGEVLCKGASPWEASTGTPDGLGEAASGGS